MRAAGLGDKSRFGLSVPPATAVRLGLGAGDRVPIRFGKDGGIAELAIAGDGSGGRLEVPRIARGMVPLGHWLTLGRTTQGLRLGPLIGVMTLHAAGRPRVTSSLGPQDASLRGVAMAARKLGAIAAVFPPAGIRRRPGRLDGYVLTPGAGRNRWRRHRLPFPDIIYNRVSSRSAERQAAMKAFYRRLEGELGHRFFNPHYLDKWNVYKLLRMRPEAAAYLPATMRFGGGGFVTMVDRYPVLYLKQAGGSLGVGIVKIERTGLSRFTVRHQMRPGRVRRLSVTGAARLRGVIRSLVRARRYIVQQGVPLATFEGRVFDVRALAQKDGRGVWTVTGMAARVARRGGIATHVPNGGTRQPLLRALGASFGSPDRVREIIVELERAVGLLAEGLDAELGHRFGELSLDMAVDRDGRVWVLEINSKPFRFDEDAIREYAWTKLVLYCRYLVGFDPLMEEGGDGARSAG